MDSIRENLAHVRQRMGQAAEISGRRLSDITLVGVTKTIAPERVQALADLGVLDLGENRVQEILEKYPRISGDLRWHMIGSLQTNKVKYIVDKVRLIHSVDSLRLMNEIDRLSGKAGLTNDILIEINIAGEATKHGIDPVELKDFLAEARNLSNIKVKGLMTVAPYVENPEENRIYFAKMRNLLVDNNIESTDNINMIFLSMGMTNDYPIAIEEGANIVRVGTGLFGAR